MIVEERAAPWAKMNRKGAIATMPVRWLIVIMAVTVMGGPAGRAPASGVNADAIKLQPGVTRLAEIGQYRVGYQRRGEPGSRLRELRNAMMPEGWVGHFEEGSGVSYTPWVRQGGKETILLHCPWRGGTGVSFVEYDLVLPPVKPVIFRFAIAMQEALTENSDGATFRALVKAGADTVVICDEHRKSTEWKEFALDLSSLADHPLSESLPGRERGSRITLRLEVGPGPKDDPSFDYSLWGDAQISAGARDARSGSAAQPHSGAALSENERMEQALQARDRWRKAVAKTDLRKLANRSDVGCRPTCDDRYENAVRRDGDAWVFEYHGSDVRMSYRLAADGDPRELMAQVEDLPPFPVASGFGPEGLGWRWRLDAAQVNRGRLDVRGHYENGEAAVPVRMALGIAGKTIVVSVEAPAGVERFSLGSLGPVPLRRVISVPYLFAGDVRYLPYNGLYYSALLDWAETNATSQAGTTAHYDKLTDGSRRPVREVGYITVSPDLREVLPNIPLPPSPYLKELAPRVMLDIWGGTFAENAQTIRDLADYGVTNAAIINHVWQRGGYDNEYPTVLPANAGLGGDEKLREFSQAAKDAGHLFSLHENYVDFYPNSELYTEQDVACNPQGKLQLAWYNGATKIQSYALKPTAFLKYARQFSPQIHRRYGTTAGYLDVHPSAPPWFRVDFNAAEPGAGEARTCYDANVALFAFERQAHRGPLFGEGSMHMYLAGAADGVEAQVVGGEDAPLLLDFDLLKIHPQMMNHGMGYHERWLREGYGGDWGGRVPPQYRVDKYRSMEIAYGHAGFVANQVLRQPSYAVKEAHLVAPVQARYGAAKAVAIEYEVAGRMVEVSDAVAAAGALDRVHVKYDSGLEVWVNHRRDDWQVEGHVIPEHGFWAKAPGMVAYCGRRGGLYCDYAETPRSIFADARSYIVQPWRDITPRVARFESLGGRRFGATYEWRVNEALGTDYQAFVHFADAGHKEGIVFQQDHAPPVPTSRWQPGQVVTDGPYEIVVPEKAGDHFVWTTGLYSAARQVSLRGKRDATGRIVLGELKVAPDGLVTFSPTSDADITRDAAEMARRMNPQRTMIDFGKVATGGAVFIRREGDALRVVPVPREMPIDVALPIGLARNGVLGLRWDRVEVVAQGVQGRELKRWTAPVAHGVVSLRLDVPGARSYVLTRAAR